MATLQNEDRSNWVYPQTFQPPDDTISFTLQPCKPSDIDFRRSIVTLNGETPTYEDLLQLSQKLQDPDTFLTMFTQCCMVQPVLYLRKHFQSHIAEIPDPLIFDVLTGTSCVVVDVHKSLRMFESVDTIDDAQMVRVRVQHVSFYARSPVADPATVAEFRYFTLP